ncbi:hypothetical protein K435DRAFT_870133 [Dendrothele bispora CBS 962.96]|uniref:Uncharacterized protein n=1 Tax=Dendrothele bispora (strain CBS 962.96) TaxID=1314807 RepID=A0A4V4HCT4_DENBC|nr:hypothetical protein K435DRAFT_870133 [Dendrothele bispora CBS 962.96]
MASMLDNAFGRIGYEEREGALQRADEILGGFMSWPFGSAGESIGFALSSSPMSNPREKKKLVHGSRIATGSSGDGSRENILGGTDDGAQAEEEDEFRVGSGGFESAA